MVIKVQNETPFQVLSDSFTIGPSETGYELQVGATSQDFSTLFSVGANTPRMVTNVANGSYYRLKGNSGEVSVNWQRTCKGGGGEGGSGTELSPVMEFPASAETGAVVSYAGSASATGVYQYNGTDWVPVGVDDLSAYWTSAETKDYVDTQIDDVELPIAAAVNELKGDMEARLDQQYYKKQEVNNLLNEKVSAVQVNEQIKDYTDPAIAEVYDTIEDKELPVSAALNELNTKTVKSNTINTMWKGTQSEYDTLTNSGATADPNTFYIIINN